MSDEKKCPEHKCDSENEFSCGDGYCITSRYKKVGLLLNIKLFMPKTLYIYLQQ
jgi:hypothetical protein